MPTVTFGGLATGIDSNSIIDKLVELEALPARRLESRKADAQKRSSVLSDLIAKLSALATAAAGVDTAAELRPTKLAVTGSELTATAGSGASVGTWNVQVSQLARAEANQSASFATRDAGVAGAGAVDVTVGGGAPTTVSWSATDSLDDIAARFDALDGVSAGVVDTGAGFRLLVSAESTGVAGALAFTESGDPLGLTETQAASDAAFTINGVAVTRASNTVTDAINGVTLQLAGVTASGGAGAQLQVQRDPAAARAKVQAVVDAHNAVVKVLQGQLTYTGVERGEESLFGDSTLQTLQRRLGTAWSSPLTSGTGQVSARDAGIKLANDGTLSLDAATFDAFAEASPAAIEDLLGGTTGIGGQLDALVDEMTRSSTGLLTIKQDSIRVRTRAFDDQIARIEDAADALGERLRKQFSSLEQAVSLMQSNLTYLSSLFASK